MGAAQELDGGSDAVSLHDLRPLVGAQVDATTDVGSLHGTLLSCTKQSAWIVVGDVDHVVALPRLLSIHRS